MASHTVRIYTFDQFRLDSRKRLLTCDGQVVPLTSKVFDTLLALIERRDNVVSKEDLMRTVWPDTSVDENNLAQQISTLRKMLGERARDHRFIVTVPGRGYSFIADVTEANESLSDLVVETTTKSEITFNVEETENALTRTHSSLLPALLPRARMSRFRLAMASVIVISTLCFGIWWHFRNSDQTESGLPIKSLAILPFRSLSESSEGEHLANGMNDALVAKLANLRRIAVRPTSSVMRYADHNKDALLAGRELGVDLVLEGTVQHVDHRVRVTVQLVNVHTGQPVWAQSFDESLSEIFVVQDEISEHVVEAMSVKLGAEDHERLQKRYTESIDAYQAYLRGRYFWNKRDQENIQKGLAYFQEAVQRDPNYALAYAGLADSYNLLIEYGYSGRSTEANYLEAKAAALKALEIDDTLAEGHASLASIRLYYERDYANAEKGFKRAIELNPNYATAHHWYADCLAMMGRESEALDHIRQAVQLEPLSPIINATLAEHLYYARRYDETITQLQKTLELHTGFFPAHFFLGLAYEQQGKYDEAIAELRKAKEYSRNRPNMVAALGHSFAVSGNRKEARRLLAQLLNADSDLPYEIATIYLGLGEQHEAMRWLQKVKRQKLQWLLKNDPRLDGLRSNPNFQTLVSA